MVEAGQQHTWVAVLLGADGEHVEQCRPDEVVDRHAERGEPVGHRVVRVGRGRLHLDLEAGDVESAPLAERVVCRQIAGCERRVRRVAEAATEPYVDQRVGPVGG